MTDNTDIYSFIKACDNEFNIEFPLFIINSRYCCKNNYGETAESCYCIRNHEEFKKIILCENFHDSIFANWLSNTCKKCDGCIKHKQFINDFNNSVIHVKIKLLKEYVNSTYDTDFIIGDNRIHLYKEEYSSDFEIICGSQVLKMITLFKWFVNYYDHELNKWKLVVPKDEI